MIVNVYKGGGRQAHPAAGKARGSFLYRLFMRWFGTPDLRA